MENFANLIDDFVEAGEGVDGGMVARIRLYEFILVNISLVFKQSQLLTDSVC